MKSILIDYIKGLEQIFFPNVCASCLRNMAKNEEVICTVCEWKLPYTKFHLIEENTIEKRFWGRVPIERASSFLFFQKGSATQKLISLLKYQNRQDVGKKLGKLYAQQLLNDNAALLNIDVIVPVPLHIDKQKMRGYNQSDSIAFAMGEVLKVPVLNNSVVRIKNNITQTGKSRKDRWENVEKIFEVKFTDKIKGKHILLIDDVVTTGATIEACAAEILSVPNTKVSILTLACAI
jgi:ComF family protein